MSRHLLILALLAVLVFAVIGGTIVHKARAWGTLPRNRVRHLRLRLHLRRRPGRGFSTGLQLWLRWSRFAAWRESGRIRPSLGAWYRLLHPAEHSVYIGRAHWWRTLRVSNQEHLLITGPPRSFKTGLLTRLVLSAPGAAVCTSSKPDLFSVTSGVRQLRGPVHVFNPQGIGGVPSTIRWSPVDGCTDVATATRRAEAFAAAVNTGGTDDAKFWDSTAAGCLRALFTAAALVGGDMRLVTRWAHGDGTNEAIQTLQHAGTGPLAGALRILVGKAEKTAETVRAVLNQALNFMADPDLAAATLPVEGDGFDIDAFLLGGGTLYMIAKSQGRDCSLAPVFAAIANEIEYRATQLGAQMHGGRLDPPLRMVLDEVTQICPVPLPQWLADAGGQGVQVCTGFHGIAQLRERWGTYGAQSILDTTSVRMYLGGLADSETLRHASELSGQVTCRERGREHWDRADVLTPAMVRELPIGFALLLRGPHSPVIAKLARGWKDREYKRARRGGYAVAQLEQATALPMLDRIHAESLTADDFGPSELDPATGWPAFLRPPAAPVRDPGPAPWDGGYPAGEDEPEIAEVLPPEPEDDEAAYPWSVR